MFGGVRTASCNSTPPRPPSSAAISVAELPGPDHQHLPAAERLRFPVLRAEWISGRRYSAAARPVRDGGHPAVAGGDDDRSERPGAARGVHGSSRPRRQRSIRSTPTPSSGLMLEVVGVVAQVADEVVAADPATVRARDRAVGQSGQGAHRVQPEGVPAVRPGTPDPVGLLQHGRSDAALSEQAATARPAGPAPMTITLER